MVRTLLLPFYALDARAYGFADGGADGDAPAICLVREPSLLVRLHRQPVLCYERQRLGGIGDGEGRLAPALPAMAFHPITLGVLALPHFASFVSRRARASATRMLLTVA